MSRKYIVALLLVAFTATTCWLSSCKGKKGNTETTGDTTAVSNIKQPAAPIQHGDTSLVPELAGVLDSAFAYSLKKDYAHFAGFLMYRGADEARTGNDVFTYKTPYEKGIIKITSDVFNKWVSRADSSEYGRLFELPQPNGQSMQVLEVIFTTPKTTNRKFFGFLKINGSYRIADVISNLPGYN